MVPATITFTLVLFGVGFSLGIYIWAEFFRRPKLSRWIKCHKTWLGAHSSWTEQDLVEIDPPGFSDPLNDRKQILTSLSKTALAEGDLGGLVLKRNEVPGQFTLGRIANILTSTALAFTILGLIVTLSLLVSNIESSAEDAARAEVGAEVTEQQKERLEGAQIDVKAIASAMKELPWFFIPTFFGVCLGTLASFRQNQLDEEIESLWDRLDDFTLVHMLPYYVKPKVDIDTTTETLARAADKFESSGQRLESTITSLESAAGKLAELDPTQWAKGLKQASETFEELTKTGMHQLSSAAGSFEKQTQSFSETVAKVESVVEQQADTLKLNVDGVNSLTKLLEEAETQRGDLVRALAGFEKSVGELSDLREKIEGFGTNVDAFGDNVTNWARTQNESTSKLVKEVGKVTGVVEPVLEKWNEASDFFTKNHETILESLNELVGKFEDFHRRLEISQDKQVGALEKVSTDFGKQNIEYWAEARTQLSEQFDKSPELLAELRNLIVAMEAAQTIGPAVPKLVEELEHFNEHLNQKILDLENSQKESSQAVVVASQEHSERLMEKVEKIIEAQQQFLDQSFRNQEKLIAAIPVGQHNSLTPDNDDISERTILGLKVGPPNWIKSLLRRLTKPGG